MSWLQPDCLDKDYHPELEPIRYLPQQNRSRLQNDREPGKEPGRLRFWHGCGIESILKNNILWKQLDRQNVKNVTQIILNKKLMNYCFLAISVTSYGIDALVAFNTWFIHRKETPLLCILTSFWELCTHTSLSKCLCFYTKKYSGLNPWKKYFGWLLYAQAPKRWSKYTTPV